MKCPVCGGAMTALLTSLVCDHCAAPRAPAERPPSLPWHGYVLLGDTETLPGRHRVFATRADAESWSHATRSAPTRIEKVGAAELFRWKPLRGPKLTVIAADREHEIVDDLALEPTPGRAFVIPAG